MSGKPWRAALAWTAAAAATAAAVSSAAPAATAASLYTGPGPRPGPAILYRPLAIAPQLTNAGIWHAPPILVSGTTAYRDGEFLYQDFLYDDHGAHELPDPTAVLPSLRNLPIEMWNNMPDELVNPAFYLPVAQKLASLGYRYRIQIFQPCANPTCLATPFPNHLQLTLNDQFAPAAAFLGTALVNSNPPHVTYVVDPARDKADVGLVGDHTYWVYALTVRTQGSEGEIDAISHGFGAGDPTPSGVNPGVGTLQNGNLGTLAYTSATQTWGATPKTPRSDTLYITATNIKTASIDVTRAHLDCNVHLNVTTDGPLTVTLAPCGRTLHFG